MKTWQPGGLGTWVVQKEAKTCPGAKCHLCWHLGFLIWKGVELVTPSWDEEAFGGTWAPEQWRETRGMRKASEILHNAPGPSRSGSFAPVRERETLP